MGEPNKKEISVAKELLEQDYDWLQEQDDGTFLVKTKKGNFVMKEQLEKEVAKCERLANNTNNSLQTLLAVASIQSPEISQSDFSELPASVSSKLKFAAAKINGLTDFL